MNSKQLVGVGLAVKRNKRCGGTSRTASSDHALIAAVRPVPTTPRLGCLKASDDFRRRVPQHPAWLNASRGAVMQAAGMGVRLFIASKVRPALYRPRMQLNNPPTRWFAVAGSPVTRPPLSTPCDRLQLQLLMANHNQSCPPPMRRSVSPLGTSRFERPFSPSSARNENTLASPTTYTSTTTPLSTHTPISAKYARSTPVDSMFSYKMDTSPTSVSSNERLRSSGKDSVESPVCTVSPDEWFARFHTASDYDGAESDECPDRATLAAVKEIPIFDAEGNERTFGSIYDPATATHQRQLVIFVRHFYCGACQVRHSFFYTANKSDIFF